MIGPRQAVPILIAERILQRKLQFYNNSPAMERGLMVEAEAVDLYEFDQDVAVQKSRLITDDNHTIGCSPDRLVGDDGLLEIKVQLLHTQIEYFPMGSVMLPGPIARSALRLSAQLGRYRLLARRAGKGDHAG